MTDRLLTLLLIVIALSGCSVSQTPLDPNESKFITESYSIWGDSVAVLKLQDGTRCAIYQGYKAGGISCDWDRHE